jgi:SulP family sulfate permease
MAGIVVAIMLVPQSMAYALLAGLPPQVGLYASIAPLLIYGLLGSSRALAVGPVAIVSLLVASGVGPLAGGDVALYVQLALALALMVGIIQTAMGLFRIGFLVNFLSHPVLVGFTAAAAIVIGFSQVKHVLGFSVPRSEYLYERVWYTLTHLGQTNFVTVAIGVGSIALLLLFKNRVSDWLQQTGVPLQLSLLIAKSAPLVVVVLGTLSVRALALNEIAGVSIVGEVPPGLPPLTLPLVDLSVWALLVPTALAISFVGYMESISVAKSLASRRREKIDANQELIALGTANLGAAFTGGYPVTGGFSRSIVNFAAGARTGLASIITAGLIALTLVMLTPLFFYLPNAVLAAIILVAVANLIDTKAIKHIWHYNKGDALALVVTFIAVLAIGIELGILVGVGVSLAIFIWRTSRPHIAVVGRVGESEVYRNELRHAVQTCPHVLAMRVDESLYFANTKYLEDTVLQYIVEQPKVRHLVLIGSAINFIDASALETLQSLRDELRAADVQMHLADFKGPVLDQLRSIGFLDEIGTEHIHFSTHAAMRALECVEPGGQDGSVGHVAPTAQLERVASDDA